MKNQLEVSIEIIVHATEDSQKFFDVFSELFSIEEDGFSRENLTGHFENPITLFRAKLTKKTAADFVEKLVSKIPEDQLEEIKDELESRIQNSTLFLRFSKQDFIEHEFNLQEKEAIKVKIFTPIYSKKNTVKTFTELMHLSN